MTDQSSFIQWSRYGGYDVTTQGDKRFSPLVITLADGRTIEQHYQCDVKGYEPGGTNWMRYKGKPPLIKMSRPILYAKFKLLYLEWASENGILLDELLGLARQHNNTLSDRFATSDINQARVLSEILNDRLELW